MQRTLVKNIDAGKVYEWLSEILTPASFDDSELLDLTRLEGVDEPKLYKRGLNIKAKTLPFEKQTDHYEDYWYLVKTTEKRIKEVKERKIKNGGFRFYKYEKLGNFIFSLDGKALKGLLGEKVPDEIDGVFVKTHLINYREGIYTFGFVEVVIHSRLNLLREKFVYKEKFYPVCYNYTQLFDVRVSKNDIRSLNIFDFQKNELHEARMYYKNELFENGRSVYKRNKEIETKNVDKNPSRKETVNSENYLQGYDVYVVAFMEKVDGDQKDLFGKEVSIPTIESVKQCEKFVTEQRKIFLQLLYALYCGHKWFEFAHRDCHSSNVMFKYFKGKQHKTVNIIIPGQDKGDEDLFFKFQTKYFVKIIDFGYSRTNLPDEQTQNEDFDRKLINESLGKFGEKNQEYGYKGFLKRFLMDSTMFSDLTKYVTSCIGEKKIREGKDMYRNWKMLFAPKLHGQAKDLKYFLVDLFKDPYSEYKKIMENIHAKIDQALEDSKIKAPKKIEKIINVCYETGEDYRYTRFIANFVTPVITTLKYSVGRYDDALKKIRRELKLQKRDFKFSIAQVLVRLAVAKPNISVLSDELLKCLRVKPERYIQLMKTHKLFDPIRMKTDEKKINTSDYTFVYHENPKYDEKGRFVRDENQFQKNEGLEDMFMQIKNNEI